MIATVLYTNFGGMLVHEDRGGVQRTYVHDEIGNTSYLVDSSGAVTDSYTYTPYGQASHTGLNVTHLHLLVHLVILLRAGRC